MPTTSNFGWTTPADTDLVKDGAAAIRTLGNGIDTSMAQLKGGTTGQILSKTSATDMAFTWINNDQGDITAVTANSPITGGGTTGAISIGIQDGTTAQKGAVQLEDSIASTSTTTAATPNSVKTAYDLANGAIAKSLVDAKGDLIAATADNTVARLASSGVNNQVLMIDTSTATGLKWATPSAGGYTSLASGTLSSTAVNISGISGSYRDLVLVIRNYDPGTDGAALNIRINNDSGANRYGQSDSFGYGSSKTFALTFWETGSTGQDDTVTNGISYLRIFDYANATTWKLADWRGFFVNPTTTTNFNWWINNFVYNQTGAVTQINILPTTGSFSGGTYSLYGVA